MDWQSVDAVKRWNGDSWEGPTVWRMAESSWSLVYGQGLGWSYGPTRQQIGLYYYYPHSTVRVGSYFYMVEGLLMKDRVGTLIKFTLDDDHKMTVVERYPLTEAEALSISSTSFIVYDGTYLWVSGGASNSRVMEKYTLTGEHIGSYTITDGVRSAHSWTYTGTYFFYAYVRDTYMWIRYYEETDTGWNRKGTISLGDLDFSSRTSYWGSLTYKGGYVYMIVPGIPKWYKIDVDISGRTLSIVGSGDITSFDPGNVLDLSVAGTNFYVTCVDVFLSPKVRFHITDSSFVADPPYVEYDTQVWIEAFGMTTLPVKVTETRWQWTRFVVGDSSGKRLLDNGYSSSTWVRFNPGTVYNFGYSGSSIRGIEGLIEDTVKYYWIVDEVEGKINKVTNDSDVVAWMVAPGSDRKDITYDVSCDVKRLWMVSKGDMKIYSMEYDDTGGGQVTPVIKSVTIPGVITNPSALFCWGDLLFLPCNDTQRMHVVRWQDNGEEEDYILTLTTGEGLDFSSVFDGIYSLAMEVIEDYSSIVRYLLCGLGYRIGIDGIYRFRGRIETEIYNDIKVYN